MKKAICVLLCACFMIGIFAGCKDNGNDSGTEQQTGWEDGVNMNSEEMIIASNNEPFYTIIVPDDATAAVRFAASELSSFIRQTAGAVLPVSDESAYTGDKFISIGRTEKLKNSGINFDYSTLNSDGFFIKTVGNDVFIDGGNDRGRLYGAYEFVERFAGVRFLTAESTYLPERDAITIRQLDIVERPVFRQRNYYGGGIGSEALFEARSRMYSDFSVVDESTGYTSDWYRGISTHHNTLNYVPQSVYNNPDDKENYHPEFYSSYYDPEQTGWDEIDFTNGITEDGEIDETMDISVAKVVLENLKKYILEDKNAKFFMIGMSDSVNNYCKSEVSLRRAEENGGKAGVVVIFVNAIARAIEEWKKEACPDREINLVIFAYLWSEQPPVIATEDGYKPFNDKVIPEKNVHVRLAPINRNLAVGCSDPRQKPEQRAIIEGWAALTGNLMIWDYGTFFTKGYLWYMPNLSYLADDIKYFEDIGATYMMMQSSNSTRRGDWQHYLKSYICSKLYWDSSLNVRDLMNEFISCYNGDVAAPYISSFIELMENHYALLLKDVEGFDLHANMPNWYYHDNQFYPTELLEKAYSILLDGRAAIAASEYDEAEKSMYDKRMGEVLLIAQYMILENFNAYQYNKIDFVTEFNTNAKRAGFTMIGENEGYDEYIAQFNVTFE